MKIRYEVLTEVISRSNKVNDIAFDAAQIKFDLGKEKLISKFNSDAVTKELESSMNNPDSDNNISNTLGGYGNLYSFIGFNEGENPVEGVRQVLEDEFILIKSQKPKTSKGKSFKSRIIYNFSAKIPNDKLNEVSKMPWENLSWIRGISKGISGAGQYFRGIFNNSRSGGGIQTKTSRTRTFKRRDYLFEWINDAIKNLRGGF